LGKEREYEIRPAEKRKQVLIVGGGPGGMEAARVAALRGHDVTLYVREGKLGGLLPIAELVKGRKIEDLSALIKYFQCQIIKLGVKVNLGKEIDVESIDRTKADVVIVATGGLPSIPDISGINERIVVSSTDLHRKLKIYLRVFSPHVLRWLTKFWMPVGKRVVIIGGALQGCELAEFLVKRGRQVTIVEESDTLGDGMGTDQQLRLLKWFQEKRVTVLTQVKCEEITENGITIVTKEGIRKTIVADTIVPALPVNGDMELTEMLGDIVPAIYAVGDCREPGLIIDTVADGARVGHTI